MKRLGIQNLFKLAVIVFGSIFATLCVHLYSKSLHISVSTSLNKLRRRLNETVVQNGDKRKEDEQHIKIKNEIYTTPNTNFQEQIHINKSNILFHYTIPPKPVKDIYYLKVHKTGSSTFQNILLRFGFDNGLQFAAFNCLHGMAFPNPAKEKYLVPGSYNKSINIVAEHTRFDPEAIKSYMSPDTKIIGQIRHPLKFLTSLFGFEFLYKRFHLLTDKQPVHTFLSNPKMYDKLAVWQAGSNVCLPLQAPSCTQNSLSYHMGYYNQSDLSQKSIQKFLKYLDKHVVLVLILEKFDESLLLLKKLFNWQISDILYLPIGSLAFHARKIFKTSQGDADLIKKHKAWSPVDYAVYEHFTKKLDIVLDVQDKTFFDELEYFKTLTPQVKDFCTQMCSNQHFYGRQASFELVNKTLAETKLTFTSNRWHDDFSISYMDCVKMVLSTAEYQHAILVNQLPSACSTRPPKLNSLKINKTFCSKKEHLFYTFSYTFVKYKVFNSKPTCLKFVNG